MNYYTIELYLYESQSDYDGTIQTEDRYIIVDANGYDALGEHMNLKDAKELINRLTEED
jgi:hypothetical protein